MSNTAQWLGTALTSLITNKLSADMKAQSDGNGLSLSLPTANSSQPTITLDELHSDDSGLSAHLHLDNLNNASLSTHIFGGFSVGLTGFDLKIESGGLSSSEIKAQLAIPYFTHSNGSQEKIDVDVGIRHDGSLTLILAPQQSNPDHMTPDGLLKLTYNIGSDVSIELDLDTLEFENTSANVYQLVLGGKLIISTLGLNWPSFDFKGLRIDSQGQVQLDGGWIDLPDHTALDFYGFHVSLQKLGFGSDPTGRWIGFNGDIHLVEGIPLGGSVRGLRLDLEHGKVSFDGVGVAFEIPGVLSFDGEIDHIQGSTPAELEQGGLPKSVAESICKISPPVVPVNLFVGHVDVTVYPAGNLETDATFVVGNFKGMSVFFLVLDVELPVGFPIFLDVSLYGIEGLVASNFRPDPVSRGQTWWDWYKYQVGSTNTDYSATDVNKWLAYPEQGAFALGAGATIGTSADDGYLVSAAITFVLLLPGPAILFTGKAKILSKRVSNARDVDDPNIGISFDAMAAFDGHAGTFDLDIDARYQIPYVLDIEASAALHVDAPKNAWYFAIGLPPHDKRVRARIFDLFETDAYFVVSDKGLITGTYTGYNREWDFGPLNVSINVYLATLAAIQWSPLLISGGIELHGEAHLSAFGIHLGVTADALLEGRAPDPLWIHGEFHVELETPWPLPDVGATVSLTWGEDSDSKPPVPLALSHVDATLIDHVGSSDRYTLLAHRPGGPQADPNLVYDPNTPGLLESTPYSDIPYWTKYWAARWATQQNPPVTPPSSLSVEQIRAILPDLHPDSTSAVYAPVIPQDAHFTLNFAHPIIDFMYPIIDSQPFIANADFHNGQVEANVPKEPAVTGLPAPLVPSDDMSNLNPQPPSPQWTHKHYLYQVALYQYKDEQWQVVASKPTYDPNMLDLSVAWLSTTSNIEEDSQYNTQLKITPYQPAADKQNVRLGILPEAPALYALKTVTKIESQHVDGSNPQSDYPIIEFAYFQTTSGPGAGYFTALPRATPPPPVIDMPKPGTPPFPAVPPDYQQIADKAPLVTSAFPRGGQLLDLHTYTQWSWPEDGNMVAYYGYDVNVEFNEPYVNELYKALLFSSYMPQPHSNAGGIHLASLSSEHPLLDQPNLSHLQNISGSTQLSGETALSSAHEQPHLPDSTTTQFHTLASVNPGLLSTLHFRCVDRNHRHVFLLPVAIHVPSIPQQNAVVGADIPLNMPPAITHLDGRTREPKTDLTHQVLSDVHVALQSQARQFEQAQLLGQAVPVPTDGSNPAVAKALKPQAQMALETLATRANLKLTPDQRNNVALIPPDWAAMLILQAMEEAAAQEARALWPQSLQPHTRYTLDVVAGPFNRVAFRRIAVTGSLSAIYNSGADAITILTALKSYYAYEDALTPLQRVQFTTSRYATFSEHLANAVEQSKITSGAEAQKSGVAALRHYSTSIKTIAWLSDASAGDGTNSPQKLYADKRDVYTRAQNHLAAFVKNFDPMADDLPKHLPPPPDPDHPLPTEVPANPAPAADWPFPGQSGLRVNRGITEHAWQDFSTLTSSLFDKLIVALGRPDLVSNQHVQSPPDTELSVFEDSNGRVQALLLESPEPLPWRHMWQWISLKAVDEGAIALNVLPLWSTDGTRAVLLPIEAPQHQGRLLGRPHEHPVVEGNRPHTELAHTPTGGHADLEATILRSGVHFLPSEVSHIGDSIGHIHIPPPPTGKYVLAMSFQGNIGAEAPCITLKGQAVTEEITFAALVIIPPPPPDSETGSEEDGEPSLTSDVPLSLEDTYEGLPQLQEGAKGPLVRVLQAMLNANGANPLLEIDGKFGPLTSAAVTSFQTTHALGVDGIVGPLTWIALATTGVYPLDAWLAYAVYKLMQ